jgi:branched-chain amino acid transport system substrate-binding protein
MMARKIRVVLTALCVFALFLGAGTQGQAEAVKIGVVMGLSGPPVIVDFADAAMLGIRLAVKEYNAAGGYKGSPVELIVYDDEANPKRAVEMVTRLITHDKVVAIMGTVSSGNVLAFMHLNQEKHIPLMAGPSIASPITDRYKNEAKNYIFRGSMREEYQIDAILDYSTKKSKKVGLIHSTTGYGMFAKKEIENGMKKRGRDLVAVESYTIGAGDIMPQVLKNKNAGAEVLLNFTEEPDLISKACNKLDYRPIIIGNWGLGGYKVFNLIGKDLIQGVMMGMTVDVSEPKASVAHNKFKAEYGSKYDWPAVTFPHYDGARILLEALNMAGPNPEGIRDALERIDDFDAATTAIPKKPFSKDDHEILDEKGVFLGVWKGDIVVRARQ